MKVQFLTNGKNLATRQRFRGKQVDAAMQAQARQWGEVVKRNAVRLSQGTISRTQQRGYKPGLYSKARAGNPAFDAIINKQSGNFARSWRMGVWTVGGGVTVTVWNQAPYAQYFQGTRLMRRRPILEAAQGAQKPFLRQMLAAKRGAEASASGSMSGALVMELVGVAYAVTTSYGGAAMGA